MSCLGWIELSTWTKVSMSRRPLHCWHQATTQFRPPDIAGRHEEFSTPRGNLPATSDRHDNCLKAHRAPDNWTPIENVHSNEPEPEVHAARLPRLRAIGLTLSLLTCSLAEATDTPPRQLTVVYYQDHDGNLGVIASSASRERIQESQVLKVVCGKGIDCSPSGPVSVQAEPAHGIQPTATENESNDILTFIVLPSAGALNFLYDGHLKASVALDERFLSRSDTRQVAIALIPILVAGIVGWIANSIRSKADSIKGANKALKDKLPVLEAALVDLACGRPDRAMDDLEPSYRAEIQKKAGLRRLVNAQLAFVQARHLVNLQTSHPTQLDILGINAIGPIHQGREVIRDILRDGGCVRVLLADPDAPSFARRTEAERDGVGRILAEQCASIHILADILEGLRSLLHPPRLSLRLHRDCPNASALIVDSQSASRGVALWNKYPTTKDVANGAEVPVPGSRGLEGRMWRKDACEPSEVDEFNRYVHHFEQLWNSGTEVRIISIEKLNVQTSQGLARPYCLLRDLPRKLVALKLPNAPKPSRPTANPEAQPRGEVLPHTPSELEPSSRRDSG